MCFAQVSIDGPLQLTGGPDEQRIEGITAPTELDQLITVGFAVKGLAHWCNAQLVGDTLELTLAPQPASLSDGTLLRFRSADEIYGELFVRVGNSAPLALVRSDGGSPVAGQIRAGSICEVLLHADSFTLIAPVRRGCPNGTVQLNSRVCIDSTVINTTTYYDALDHCASRGGRLCTWEEFYLGCTHTNPVLGDVLLNWEWVDDTANHTHTNGQAGGVSCMGQRSVPTLVQVPGATRCCYHLR